MKSWMKRTLSFALQLCLILSVLSFSVSATNSETEQSPATSNNWNDYNYINASRWTTPIYSYLEYENGGYTRVEAIGDVLTVERYDEQMQFLSRNDIPLELPIFGGAYLCEDYNFIVVGQENAAEDDEVEVVRIIRYTKDWARVDSVGLFGANTTVPFDAGCLRFARKDNLLFARTSHEMYTTDDGLNHQANMTFCVNITAMEMEYATYLVEFNPFGYVSHSFNQFILVDGDDVLTLDHGDAYPRSVVMHRSDLSNGIPTGWYQPETVDVFPIADSTGHYNDTGVSLGGFEYSATHYLVAGNSTSQDGGIDFRGYQRNIFITATPKDDFSAEATTVTWITDYEEGADVALGTPMLTKLNDGRFLLMWAVDDRINFCFITEDGQLDGDVYEMEGRLSDCMPILVDSKLVWYVTNYSAPEFYSIDLNDPGQDVPHEHHYAADVLEPTCALPGCITYTCDCGDSYTEYLDALGHDYADGTCTRCGDREEKLGDVNGDGAIDTTDAKLIMQYDLGMPNIGIDLSAADVNGDGVTDTTDAKLIMQLDVGMITEFPKVN